MPEHPGSKLRPVVVPLPDAESPDALHLSDEDAGDYAELDVTTSFSFLRGASHPEEMVCRAAALGYRALAITDINSVAGVVRAHVAARELAKHTGRAPKLIIGARLTPVDAPDVLVWVPDRAAYGRLCRLITLGRRRAPKGQCLLKLQDLLEHCDGMLAGVVGYPCDTGDTPDRADSEHPPRMGLADALAALREAMGDNVSLVAGCFFGPDDRHRLRRLEALARRAGAALVAANNVHYHNPSRRMLQDVLACIRHGCTIEQAGWRLFPDAERYLKTPGRMARLFREHPQAVMRTIDIAERCRFSLDELRYEYPDEVVPGGRSAVEHLAELTWRGAAERYPAGVPDKVRRQIEHELRLIEQLRYEAYFLTVYDLVAFARSRGILCQGRGSAANSAVCYCLGITAVDPARIDLLFERFISAARNEPPDIDVDFEHERREEVLQYIYDKYGRERAGMTAEVITYRGRSAVRDVGKAMGLSLDMVDRMAGRLDWWDHGTLDDARIREIGLNPGDRVVRRVVELSGELLGFPRHLSQHVGGMVMTRGPLCELVPIENAAMDGRTVIEWDKDDIDALGILKVDVLGLGMLTCVRKAMEMANGNDGAPRSAPLHLHTIPPEDPAVYDMLCAGDSVGVFQVESRAQMSMLPRLRPRCFYDLVIEVAIVRPGPIQGDMVHPYLRRRSGREPVSYPGEALRAVLEKTLGVPLFQEQAMRVAMVAAGFSAEEADSLRRAMAAWRRGGAIEAFHQKIVSGMVKNGYTREFAEQCFHQIRGFGEYGFPESHAASFALLVYVSAWLKRYYPAAFCAALLNSQPMGFYAPAQIVRDAKEHGVEVRPADVNYSEWDCTLETGEATEKRRAEPRGCEDAKEPEEEPEPRRRDGAKNGTERHQRRADMADDELRVTDFASQISDLRSQVPDSEAGISDVKSRISDSGSRIPYFKSQISDSFAPPCLRGENPFASSRLRGFTSPQASQRSDWGRGGPAVRLGFRMIRGLRAADARRIVDVRRRVGRFRSVEELWRTAGLSRSTLRMLAEADALASLELSRRQALWQVMSLPDEPLPLFAGAADGDARARRAALPEMSPAGEVFADYRACGLSLRQHPVSLVRPKLDSLGIISAAQVRCTPHGRWVRVAGLVLVRQRPATAGGIVFETLEDETGVVNLIIRPGVYDKHRQAARHAALLQADGRVQRQGDVIHVMVRRLYDRSDMLRSCPTSSRDFR